MLTVLLVVLKQCATPQRHICRRHQQLAGWRSVDALQPAGPVPLLLCPAAGGGALTSGRHALQLRPCMLVMTSVSIWVGVGVGVGKYEQKSRQLMADHTQPTLYAAAHTPHMSATGRVSHAILPLLLSPLPHASTGVRAQV